MKDLKQTDDKELSIILRELNKIMEKNIDGDIVEFGCYEGGTSVYLAKVISRYKNKKYYTYDSFEGLPEKTTADDSSIGISFQAGELSASKKQFIKNIQKAKVPIPIIKKAWFSDLKQNDIPERICFAYLDGDYYKSIKVSLSLIQQCLVDKATIVIDDYYNEALPGVKKAVDEWLIDKPFKVRIENSLAIIQI